MKQLFISDLHLREIHHPVTKAFFAFIEQKAPEADELYILGDFFEYWIGDDAGNELSQKVADKLAELRRSHNTAIFFMVGNRDFLLGKSYCHQAGMTLIEEPYKLPGSEIVLCHGDAECIDDVEYQKVRQMLRNPQWQQAFLGKSIQERIAFAEQARAQSQKHQEGDEYSDLDDNAVRTLLEQHHAKLLIHGHTHKPGIRDVRGTGYKRLTLSDWDHEIWYAQIENHEIPKLRQFTYVA